MRDIIWTVIIIWVIWRILSAFRTFSSSSSANTHRNSTNYNERTGPNTNSNNQPKKGELKPDAGEYIDYEEVK